ncbi:hypothetical protein ABK040_010888 [Willaertia magna]
MFKSLQHDEFDIKLSNQESKENSSKSKLTFKILSFHLLSYSLFATRRTSGTVFINWKLKASLMQRQIDNKVKEVQSVIFPYLIKCSKTSAASTPQSSSLSIVSSNTIDQQENKNILPNIDLETDVDTFDVLFKSVNNNVYLLNHTFYFNFSDMDSLYLKIEIIQNGKTIGFCKSEMLNKIHKSSLQNIVLSNFMIKKLNVKSTLDMELEKQGQPHLVNLPTNEPSCEISFKIEVVQ